MICSMTKNVWIAFIVVSLLMVATPLGLAQAPNPDTFVHAVYGEPESLDPAYMYDTSSGYIANNVYENLVAYDGSSLSEFVPMLSTQVPSVQNGLISPDGTTYTFPIRKGVMFHNGDSLTPEDVEYTFERAMLQDRAGGPVWMFYEPLFGIGYSLEKVVTEVLGKSVEDAGYESIHDVPAHVQKGVYDRIDAVVEVEGDNVVFHLPMPYPAFLSILAHNAGWSSILDKEWTAAQGDWDGRATTWAEHYDPKAEDSPLYGRTNGTGPYSLVNWEKGTQIILKRFDDYWRTPAAVGNVIIKKVDEWSTRQLMLQSGDADIVQVDQPYIPTVRQMPGVKVVRSQGLSNSSIFFGFDVAAEGNEYLGSGKLDGKGIPPDFFSDIDVRKAFNYAFDWDVYIEEAMNGLVSKPYGPIPSGLPFANPKQQTYSFDSAKAEAHFKQAWDGQVWENGFQLTVLYNSGNDARRIAAEILEANIEALNPKFSIDIMDAQWPTYLQEMVQSRLPLFIIGWAPDFPDPHNFAVPYLASNGTFAEWQRLGDLATDVFDPLIKKGITATDPDVRRRAYHEMQAKAHEHAVDIFLYERDEFKVMRDWVKGFVPNPMRADPYYYPMSK